MLAFARESFFSGLVVIVIGAVPAVISVRKKQALDELKSKGTLPTGVDEQTVSRIYRRELLLGVVLGALGLGLVVIGSFASG